MDNVNINKGKVVCYCCGKDTARVMLYKKVAGSEGYMDICDKCIEQLYHAYILALKSEIVGFAYLHAPPNAAPTGNNV